MSNISSTGMTVTLIPSKTLVPITLTIFADDADPFDLEAAELAGTGKTLNGHLLIWDKVSRYLATFNVAPGTDEARNMAFAAYMNSTSEGKTSAGDVWTCAITYPNGTKASLGGGAMLSGSLIPGASQEGRQKTLPYAFEFATILPFNA